MVFLERVRAEARGAVRRQQRQMLDRLLTARWSDTPKILCSPTFFQQGPYQQFQAASSGSRLRPHSLGATHGRGLSTDGVPAPRFARYVPEGGRANSEQGGQPMQSICYWELSAASSSQRRKEEGSSPLARRCLPTTIFRGAGTARRTFSSADKPDPGHVMLSKERLGTSYLTRRPS